jgi:protoporphyrinogen oxidase
MKDPGRILILGAGPTGLGAAYRLQELGFNDFLVVEAQENAGGLSRSYVDPQGFTWDLGGHVQFSHYRYYDEALDRALGDAWIHHQRESWIWIKRRFVPYPFQYNLHRLDPEDRDRAVKGLEQTARNGQRGEARDFRQWIDATFGEGIADLFLYPYNLKIWGYPLEMLGSHWMGERVAVPDLERVRRNIQENRDDVSWGPNNTFRFPARGGTGAIWEAVAKRIEPARLLFGVVVVGVDLPGRQALLANGRRLNYEALITTQPLDLLCTMCDGLAPEARSAAAALMHSSVHVVGVGLSGGKPETVGKKCWMYFPEANSPYYRITVFSNYSPSNVPGSEYWSLMAEICESPYRPVDMDGLRSWALRAMRDDGLIPRGTEIASYWHKRLEYGYPTPIRARDELLACILPVLEKHRVFSRGRFGAYKYEVSNQDHSFMQALNWPSASSELEKRLPLQPRNTSTAAYSSSGTGGKPECL